MLLLQNLISLQNKFLILNENRANLAYQSDIANFINKTDFSNNLKNVAVYKNELIKLLKKS